MKNTNRILAIIAMAALALTGCQSLPSDDTKSAWNDMHLDQVQFISQSHGFVCLSPSGVDFTRDGRAVRRSMCAKTEDCNVTNRIFELDAHTMVVTSTNEYTQPAKCQNPSGTH